MTPEDLDPRQVEAVNDFADALLAGSKPKASGALRGEAAEALRAAALLHSVSAPDALPRASFVAELRQKFDAPAPRPSWLDFRLSRRTLGRGFAGGVAAVAVCLFGEQAITRVRGRDQVPAGWVPIAQAADLPPGNVKRFIANDVEGHVMNIGGKIWALSAICTHQACVLEWQPDDEYFQCPCHGAEFDTSGQQMTADGYQKAKLPPLARIPVQQLNGTIYADLRGW